MNRIICEASKAQSRCRRYLGSFIWGVLIVATVGGLVLGLVGCAGQYEEIEIEGELAGVIEGHEIARAVEETRKIEREFQKPVQEFSKEENRILEERLHELWLDIDEKEIREKSGSQDVLEVTHIISGDTIVLENGEEVSLIGIDCFPAKKGAELDKLAKKITFGHRKKESEEKALIISFGITASAYTTMLCKGKEVRLEYGQTKRDRHGRLLAYVYLPDGKLLNKEIILQGWSFRYDKHPIKQYLENEFGMAFRKAMTENRGIWPEMSIVGIKIPY